MKPRTIRCAALAAAIMLSGCAPVDGQPPQPGSTSTESSSAPPSTTAAPPPTTTAPPSPAKAVRVCGGQERPELSAAECDLVDSANLGLIQAGTCTAHPPNGGATAAVECRGRGMDIFVEGQEPAVYIFGFSSLTSLKEVFESQVTNFGIAERDVRYPPATGFWQVADDPAATHRGQLMSRLADGTSVFIWTDWTELTWISAESRTADVATLYKWWNQGNI